MAIQRNARVHVNGNRISPAKGLQTIAQSTSVLSLLCLENETENLCWTTIHYKAKVTTFNVCF